MIKLGLVGWPLSHSRSPQIHALALKMAGLDGSYDLYPVPTETPDLLTDTIKKIRRAEITGLNVTIPYKETVLPMMDVLSPAAAAIGAVNTIVMKDGQLVGDNTDAGGFAADLVNNGLDPHYQPGEAIVFGAGGSARSVFYALLSAGWQIHALVRNVEKSRHVVSEFRGKKLTGGIKLHPISDLGSILKTTKIDLIVNSTPLGMSPNVHASAWPEGIAMPSDAFVYDLVYNPVETLIMRQGIESGLRVSNGWGMLVEQALLAFEIWTGRHIERAWFTEAFEKMNLP